MLPVKEFNFQSFIAEFDDDITSNVPAQEIQKRLLPYADLFEEDAEAIINNYHWHSQVDNLLSEAPQTENETIFNSRESALLLFALTLLTKEKRHSAHCILAPGVSLRLLTVNTGYFLIEGTLKAEPIKIKITGDAVKLLKILYLDLNTIVPLEYVVAQVKSGNSSFFDEDYSSLRVLVSDLRKKLDQAFIEVGLPIIADEVIVSRTKFGYGLKSTEPYEFLSKELREQVVARVGGLSLLHSASSGELRLGEYEVELRPPESQLLAMLGKEGEVVLDTDLHRNEGNLKVIISGLRENIASLINLAFPGTYQATKKNLLQWFKYRKEVVSMDFPVDLLER